MTVSLLVIMLLLPTAVYDDEEPAGVVSVAGGKVIEEFESIGMVYDAAVPQNWIALFKENPAIAGQDSSGYFSRILGIMGLQHIGAEPVHLSNYTGGGRSKDSSP